MIDLIPNVTFFYQLAIFLVALIGLHFLVFRPTLRLIERRQQLTEGNRHQASELQSKTEALVENYEGQIKEARQAALALKNQQTQAGEAEAERILTKTRQELEAKFKEQSRAVQGELKEAQLILRKHSKDLSEEMAEKLLGRKVSA